MENRIHSKSVIHRNKDQLFSKIDDEVVFLSISTGEYVALNSVASQIWEHINTPLSVSTLINKLLVEYDVEREVCEFQTIECLNELLRRQIVEVDEIIND